MERPSEPIDDPVTEAASLVEQAELDVGAASLAAEVGDHDIAYALLLDAVDGWRAAGDLLLDALERVEEQPSRAPVPTPPHIVVVNPPPVAQDAVIDLREAPADAPDATTERQEPADVPAAAPPEAPAAAAGVQPVPDDDAEELDPTSHEARRARFERVRRRRRVPKGSAPPDTGGTIDPSSRIASVVVPEGTAEEYQAWVDRLRDRRAELKEAAGDIDLAAIHRAQTRATRRPLERDLAPPPW